jgi:hypothetical protein
VRDVEDRCLDVRRIRGSMEAEPLRADRDDRGRGTSDAARLDGGEGDQHLCFASGATD